MLNLIQHLTKSRTYETLKQVQGDRSGLFTRPSTLVSFISFKYCQLKEHFDKISIISPIIPSSSPGLPINVLSSPPRVNLRMLSVLLPILYIPKLIYFSISSDKKIWCIRMMHWFLLVFLLLSFVGVGYQQIGQDAIRWPHLYTPGLLLPVRHLA